ncbi:carbohydrate binding domain-containing protein [Paenibacillus qinlingensis]|uniref:CBM-cenC domain-containing protein n=1 Tax=Paenibacillus qinlingensis TaxID=1837343 RepID=A0ABU1P0N7_9BACL|nr:carbohydrate binding domain-containing protein [Paenibacillus qinlingensis]MDR6553114.1 hypothetical protein [Paenibacillus qinlingensis]
MKMKRKLLTLLLTGCMLLMMLLAAVPALAADMLATNFSFESGMTGWTYSTTASSGAFSSSTVQAHTGTKSVKMTDTSATDSYGLESNRIAATAGKTYMVYAWAYIETGKAYLYIRFYDASGNLLGTQIADKNTPTQEWTYMKVKLAAPANTATASAMLYTSTSNTGTVYWDDVYITQEFTNLGTTLTNATPQGATIGMESSNEVFYVTMQGSKSTPARIAAVDINSGSVLRTVNLGSVGETEGAWGATTSSDGYIYAATYPQAKVYKYTPGATTATDLGTALSGQTHIYNITAGLGGKIYGGTYPNAGFFRYYNGAYLQLGNMPFTTSETYVRSIAYDTVNNVSYVGLGPVAAIKRFDHTTGQTDNILPSTYASDDFVLGLNLEGSKLFARLGPSNKLVVLNVSNVNGVITTTVDAEISGVASQNQSPVYNGKVYFTINGILQAYDIASKTYSSLSADATVHPIRMGLVQLDDQANYPGTTLVGVGFRETGTRMFKYNIQTGTITYSDLNIPRIATSINAVGSGPDNKIYTSGYYSGGMGIYSPLRTDQNVYQGNIGQIESFASMGSTLYMGGYPKGRLYATTPSNGWSPTLLFDTSAYDQERPNVLATGGGKVFMGTTPVAGALGGALTIYDPATSNVIVKRNLVQDQSVISIAYKDGKVYAGTTVSGGQSATPTTSAAKLAIYDIATDTTTVKTLPVSKKALTALTVGPDGKIWGLLEGYLIIYNPTTGLFDYSALKFSGVDYSGNAYIWRDGTLLEGKFGDVLGTLDGQLFTIDASTKAVSILVPSGASALAEDELGNVYYRVGTNLYRYAY